ncbi:hypothetical protein TNIN_487791 [Trichonephila inaurata madagascariensis]|uniref:Uncharacterized protein n=1 Tax=Trichonephila inaurata madagascariensis TaxID=2747483 RepID=A0A8X6WXU2_9ARAC|nr:hypothetical protein TNIN_487791 [Trichonephila inaurata madagascariensis]
MGVYRWSCHPLPIGIPTDILADNVVQHRTSQTVRHVERNPFKCQPNGLNPFARSDNFDSPENLEYTYDLQLLEDQLNYTGWHH